MANKEKPANDRDTKFHLGVSELAESQSRREQPAGGLKLDDAQPKPAKEAHGFDPYNSGSFDRKKHWERVGKR
jgi:hypothetical protein